MKKVFIEDKETIKIDETMKCYGKYSDDEMNETSLKAWSFLNKILYENYNISINVDNIIFNEYGKPYLINNELYFNISHSNELIAIIIDDKECGIDIEFVDYSREVDKLAYKILSKSEQKKYENSQDKHKFFYKMWTKKETIFKFQGTGIALNRLREQSKYTNIKTYLYRYKNDKYYVSETK